MSDWSESYTHAERAIGELRWLLPEANWGKAQEKALEAEQALRALVEAIKRHRAKLNEIARSNPNAQVLTDARATDPKSMYGHFPPFC